MKTHFLTHREVFAFLCVRDNLGGVQFEQNEQQAYLRRIFSREASHDAGRVKERQ